MTSKYDPADFVVPAKDTRGETARGWFCMQPGHDRALDVLLNCKRFPFRSKGDIIRWCVVQGIRKLEQMEAVPSVTREVDTILDIVRDQMFHQEFSSVFVKLSEIVDRHIADGEHGEATRIVACVRARINLMEDGHWRSKYLKTLNERFSHVEKGGRKGKGHAPGAEDAGAGVAPILETGASLKPDTNGEPE